MHSEKNKQQQQKNRKDKIQMKTRLNLTRIFSCTGICVPHILLALPVLYLYDKYVK